MYERPMFDPGVEIDALKAEIARLRVHLQVIADFHIPSVPLAYGPDELGWAKMHCGRLRLIARDALNQQSRSDV